MPLDPSFLATFHLFFSLFGSGLSGLGIVGIYASFELP